MPNREKIADGITEEPRPDVLQDSNGGMPAVVRKRTADAIREGCSPRKMLGLADIKSRGERNGITRRVGR